MASSWMLGNDSTSGVVLELEYASGNSSGSVGVAEELLGEVVGLVDGQHGVERVLVVNIILVNMCLGELKTKHQA